MRTDNYIFILLAAFSLAALAACSREELQNDGLTEESVKGQAIGFSACAGPFSGTRAHPSGWLTDFEAGGDHTNFFEYMRWDYSDTFRIYSPDAETEDGSHMADYSIRTLEMEAEKEERAQIALLRSNHPLLWDNFDNEDVTFYALYPAPGDDNFCSMNESTVSGTIPSEQEFAKMELTHFLGEKDNYYFSWVPDTWRYGYMYAVAQGAYGQPYVPMFFKPLYTLISFTFWGGLNGSYYPQHLKKVTVTSRAVGSVGPTSLAGDFTADLSASGYPSVQVANGVSSISAEFPSEDELPDYLNHQYGVNYDVYLSDLGDPNAAINADWRNYQGITLLALPVPQTNLTVTFEFTDGSARNLDLKRSDGSWITVNPGERLLVYQSIPGTHLPQGSIGCFYSIGEREQVFFSQGNLQYNSGVWSFSTSQQGTLGSGNTYTSPYHIDLFAWGATGETWQPYESKVAGDTNTWSDWGAYDAIFNGTNTPGAWRTLTAAEWDYLLNTRQAGSLSYSDGGQRIFLRNVRYAKATVCGVKGLILFPNSYMLPENVTPPSGYNDSATSFSANVYDSTDWTALSANRCVFLPVTGCRADGTSAVDNLDEGFYWTSTADGAGNAYCLHFTDSTVELISLPHSRYCSVRLVKDLPACYVTGSAD